MFWVWLHNFYCYLIISLMYRIFSFIFPSPNKETSLLYHCSFHTWCCSKRILYRRILYHIRLHIKSLWNLVCKTNNILIMQRPCSKRNKKASMAWIKWVVEVGIHKAFRPQLGVWNFFWISWEREDIGRFWARKGSDLTFV